MQAIGVVRKLDNLGRITIPMTVRKKFEIDEGDSVEIFVDGERIVLQKYEPGCSICGDVKQEKYLFLHQKAICRDCVNIIKGGV